MATNAEIIQDALDNGQDPHKAVASKITGKDICDITEERDIVKETNFGTLYGANPTKFEDFRNYIADAEFYEERTSIVVDYASIKKHCKKDFKDVTYTDCLVDLRKVSECDYFILINGDKSKVLKNRYPKVHDASYDKWLRETIEKVVGTAQNEEKEYIEANGGLELSLREKILKIICLSSDCIAVENGALLKFIPDIPNNDLFRVRSEIKVEKGIWLKDWADYQYFACKR